MCRGIAQGCSEYNITVLVDQQDSIRALRAVHGRFYLATLPLGVGIVGPGDIGKTFLAQIQDQAKVSMHIILARDPEYDSKGDCFFQHLKNSFRIENLDCRQARISASSITPKCAQGVQSEDTSSLQELREDFDIDVRILGITNSSKMLISDAPIDTETWQSRFAE